MIFEAVRNRYLADNRVMDKINDCTMKSVSVASS